MPGDTTITEDDEGKPVVNQEGETIGRVAEVQNGEAYVDPDPDVTDAIMAKLGWGDREQGTFKLQESSIDAITSDQIRLGPL